LLEWSIGAPLLGFVMAVMTFLVSVGLMRWMSEGKDGEVAGA
jgi:hypothetical protein